MVDPLVLRQVPLFADLSPQELGGLAAALRRRRYPRGAVIFLAGDPNAQLYLIEAGRVRIGLTSPEGKEVVLMVLGPGDFFGDLSLLDGEPTSADAVAQEDCRLLLLPRAAFLGFVEGQPRAATALLAVLSRRLRRNARLIQDAAFLDVPARLASALLQLAQAQGERPGADGPPTAQVTQTELAGMIGATRESVNKWLGAYERQGFIRRQRGAITVVQPEGLRRQLD
jgi:CRP/FNR family transcriptional regulator, cyclic AMP receptor protein